MKGLLVKDFKMLKSQRQFFVIITLIGILFLATYNSMSFVISYITIVFSMFGITSLGYDESDNGLAYLFSLPFERKTYAVEKYVFSFLLLFTGWGVITILSIIVCFIRGMEFDVWEMGVTSLSVITLSILFLAVSLPLEFKFGLEKGRIGLIVTFAVFFVGFYYLAKAAAVEPAEVIEKILSFPLAGLTAVLCAVWFVAIGISLMISTRIITKKEF